jgi:hypothetical protein
MKVHLEGMGVNGCLLAHQLRRAGIEFTWHDDEVASPINAWRASTGCIYPSGSTKFGPDELCYNVWRDWFNELQYAPWLERSNYVFMTKRPPHEGKYEFEKVEGLHLGSLPSYHLNAQALVTSTRVAFCKDQLRPSEGRRMVDEADVYIVTHGFGQRLGAVYWGWMRPVRLHYPDTFNVGGLRPCFYFRPDRVQMAYAYPIPNTDTWYAGSSIIKQKLGKEKSLDMEAKYERWKKMFQRLSGETVEVIEAGDCVEGWRPAAAPEDTAWLRKKGNVITLRPLWNSGIRHFPFQWAALAKQLGVLKA